LFQLVITHAAKGGGELSNFIHDVAGVVVFHLVAKGVGQADGYFPVFFSGNRGHDFTYTIDTAFGVGKGAVFFQKGRAG
jgi:hypothetical protein